MVSFLLAFFSIIILAALHEFGHFFVAKKCGVKVEEFGIGYPPRIFGKKIGETLYSFNLIPLGAFVKMEGEDEAVDSERSFSNQSIGNRMLIVLGGVISFWIIAIILYSIIFSIGGKILVNDNDFENLSNFEVNIFEIAEDSPAEKAGLEMGDAIKKISYNNNEVYPTKIEEVQNFISSHGGQEINLLINRGGEEIERSIRVRESFPEGEGAMGVSLIRTAIQKNPWYMSIFLGIKETWDNTVMVIRLYAFMFRQIFTGGFEQDSLVSAVGIFQMIAQSQRFGFVNFLGFIAFISINLAVSNSLPIPLVDGGRFLFLVIEKIRNRPLPEKIQEKIDFTSLVFLGSLMVWVMVKDIINLF